MSVEALVRLITTPKRILLYGDVALDQYIEITSQRISSESLLPVMSPRRRYSLIGCGGNVAQILTQFQSRVFLVSALNTETQKLIQKNPHLDLSYSLSLPEYAQQKTRYLHQNKQYFRYDECDQFPWETHGEQMLTLLERCLEEQEIDLVVICDYKLGLCTQLPQIIQRAQQHQLKILIDPHGYHLGRYTGCHIFKPNLNEFQQLTDRRVSRIPEDLVIGSQEIQTQIGCELILVTLSEQGIFYYQDPEHWQIVPVTQKIPLTDPCGAGDMVNAIIGMSQICDLDLVSSARLANQYASLVVQKIGTQAIQFPEIFSVWSKPLQITVDQAITLSHLIRASTPEATLGATSGCFDIFHQGHMDCILYAKQQCDFLFLFLNSDESIRELKGPRRPINQLSYRLNLLQGIKDIDFIVVFEETSVIPILAQMKLDMLIKGGDYQKEELAKQLPGTEILLSPLIQDISTSLIERSIQESESSQKQ